MKSEPSPALPGRAEEGLTYRYPKGAFAVNFAEIQTQLLKKYPALWCYLPAIQKHLTKLDAPKASGVSPVAPRTTIFQTALERFTNVLPYGKGQQYEVDVLVCGVWKWQRQQEDRMLSTLIEALSAKGASVLLLIHRGSPLSKLKLPGLTVVDPEPRVFHYLRRVGLSLSKKSAIALFNELRGECKSIGYELAESALEELTWYFERRLDWEKLSDSLVFRSALVRCQWLPLACEVVKSAQARACQSAALQQGLISHLIDFPLQTDVMACFGSLSAETYQNTNSVLCDAAEVPIQNTEFVPVGNLIDALEPQDSAFERATVLVLSQANPWASSYYGLDMLDDSLKALVERLSCEEGVRTLIRLHPGNPSPEPWKGIMNRSAGKCRVSNPWEHSLQDDLNRASVAVGLFSGALLSAAAAGFPICLLTNDDPIIFPELTAFDEFRIPVSLAREKLIELVRNERAHQVAGKLAALKGAEFFNEHGLDWQADALANRLLERRKAQS